jgi:hypothetical protein
VIRRKVTK